jgi:hypothetical protein
MSLWKPKGKVQCSPLGNPTGWLRGLVHFKGLQGQAQDFRTLFLWPGCFGQHPSVQLTPSEPGLGAGGKGYLHILACEGFTSLLETQGHLGPKPFQELNPSHTGEGLQMKAAYNLI